MDASALRLAPIEGDFSVCRLPTTLPVPEAMRGGPLSAVVRTAAELSVVCATDRVPRALRAEPGFREERGWAALAVRGPLDFALVGVLSSLTGALAGAGIPVFALSTHDTDVLLVKRDVLDRAKAALSAAGHRVETGEPGSR